MTGARRAPRLGVALWATVAGGVLLLAGWQSVAFPDWPGREAAAVGMLALAALPPFAAAGDWLGRRRAAWLLATLVAYAYCVELIGVRTGWPYGAFAYGGGLGPMVVGAVPALLPLAYVPLVLAAAGVADAVRPRRGAGWLVAALAALLVFDLVIDPGAVALGYWSFADGGAYHGVPAVNYLGWALTGAPALALVAAAARRRPESPSPWMVSGALWTVAFYTGVALRVGMLLPATAGAAALVLLGPLTARRLAAARAAQRRRPDR